MYPFDKIMFAALFIFFINQIYMTIKVQIQNVPKFKTRCMYVYMHVFIWLIGFGTYVLCWFVICYVPQAGIEYVFLITQPADGWIDRLAGSGLL